MRCVRGECGWWRLPRKQLPSGAGGSNPSARTTSGHPLTRGVIGSTADSGSAGLRFESWRVIETPCLVAHSVAHRILVPGSSGSTPDEAAVLHAPFGYGLVFCPFKAEERVRVPHGVPVSGSSVGQSAALIQRRPGGSIPPRTTGRWVP